MHDCDSCGCFSSELYHFDAEVEGSPYDGLALCGACESSASTWDEEHRQDDGPFHAELRRIIEQVEGTPLAALAPAASVLLELPEESVKALHEAAVAMVDAARFGR